MKSGKLRALAVTSPKRVPQVPDVPTLAESGFPNFGLAGIGVSVRLGSAEDFGKFLSGERSKFADAVKASGATVD